MRKPIVRRRSTYLADRNRQLVAELQELRREVRHTADRVRTGELRTRADVVDALERLTWRPGDG